MTKQEADEETIHLSNLFPRVNEDLLAFWRGVFLGYDRQTVHRAVLKYYAEPGDGFIDKTRLRAMIENEAVPFSARMEAEVKRSTDYRKREAEAKAAAEASFRATEQALAGKSEQELQMLKAACLADLEGQTFYENHGGKLVQVNGNDLAKLLRRADPMHGKLLRMYMAKYLAASAATKSPIEAHA